MKTVFISYNQALKERVIEILDRMSIRGFTMMDPVQGRGTKKGDPHYGDHAWPSLNGAIITIIPAGKVDELLRKLHDLDMEREYLGLRAFVWNVEKIV